MEAKKSNKNDRLKKTEEGLEYSVDRYKSVHLRSQDLMKDKEIFFAAIDSSLKKFTADGMKAIWIKLDIAASELIPGLLKRGFYFHHAKRETAMLTKWLLVDRKDNLPVYNTHLAGVGGLVIDTDKRRVLLIQEKSGFKGIWKPPGGQIDPREFVHEAVVREVKEETGIDADFLGVVGMREVKDFRFGATDMYFVALLKAKSHEIAPCPTEVAACKWWPIEDYLPYEDGFSFTFKAIKQILGAINEKLKTGHSLEDISKNLLPSFQLENFEFSIGGRMLQNTFYYPGWMHQKL